MNSYIKQQIDVLLETYSKIDKHRANLLAKDCLKKIKNGKRIIISALGKNAPIAEKFVGTLNSLGIDAHFLDTNSAVHGDLGIVRNKDLVLVISKSGDTDETVYLSKILLSNKINSWLITCNEVCLANKYIKKHMILPIRNEGDPWNLIPNNSTLSFLAFLQALTIYLINELKISKSTLKRNHPGGSIGRKLNER